jgi:hypothetical protein
MKLFEFKTSNNSSDLPIASTKEGIENFWKWFKNSKIVDNKGNPLVVYHGSKLADLNDKEFSFDKDKLGSYTGSPSSKKGFFFATEKSLSDIYAGKFNNPYFEQGKELGKELTEYLKKKKLRNDYSVFYMGTDLYGGTWPQVLDTTGEGKIKDWIINHIEETSKKIRRYGEFVINEIELGNLNKKPMKEKDIPKAQKIKENIIKQLSVLDDSTKEAIDFIKKYPKPLLNRETLGIVGGFYLSIQDPLIYDQQGDKWRGTSFSDLIDDAKINGHDGVWIKNTFDPEPTDVLIVFDGNQIKSAEGKNETFNPNSDKVFEDNS